MEDSGMLILIILAACGLMVRMIQHSPRTIYVDRPYKETLQCSKDKVASDLQRKKEVGFAQWSKEDLASFKESMNILQEDPKPGAWSLEDHSEDGPPYFVYRDELTGKSITAVRGTKMYNEIFTGMKR